VFTAAKEAMMLGTVLYGPRENRKIDPGRFDLTLPLDQVAEGYRGIKTLLWS
jgi:hypothetical protein